MSYGSTAIADNKSKEFATVAIAGRITFFGYL